MSICGNCYFILTLLGVCHETVNLFFPLNIQKLMPTPHLIKLRKIQQISYFAQDKHCFAFVILQAHLHMHSASLLATCDTHEAF